MVKDGQRIECIRCGDSFGSVPQGTKGTVLFSNDMGQICVDWDNGQNLIIIQGVDRFKIINE